MPSPQTVALAQFDLALPILVLAVTVLILGLVQLTEAQRSSSRERLREALRMADISVTKAALWMELDSPADLQKMLNGERKLDLWRVLMLPDHFHRIWHFLELRDRGLPDVVKHALKMAPALKEIA